MVEQIQVSTGLNPKDTSNDARIIRWEARKRLARLRAEQLASSNHERQESTELDEETAKLVELAVRKANPENPDKKPGLSLIPDQGQPFVTKTEGGIYWMHQASQIK